MGWPRPPQWPRDQSSSPPAPPPRSRCFTGSTHNPKVYEALTAAGIPFRCAAGKDSSATGDPPVAGGPAACRRAEGVTGDFPMLSAISLAAAVLTAETPAGVKGQERWEALTALAELVDERGRRPT